MTAAASPVRETVTVNQPRVACDGNGASAGTGHPRVFLTTGAGGQVSCPYCSRHFVLKPRD